MIFNCSALSNETRKDGEPEGGLKMPLPGKIPMGPHGEDSRETQKVLTVADGTIMMLTATHGIQCTHPGPVLSVMHLEVAVEEGEEGGEEAASEISGRVVGTLAAIYGAREAGRMQVVKIKVVQSI